MKELFQIRESGLAIRSFFWWLCCILLCASWAIPVQSANSEEYVAVIEMDMMILPGTSSFLTKAIAESQASGAKLLVVKLDTPGGLLTAAEEMIQAIFKAPLPVVVYVSPSGGTATSAGVFITLAGHVAVMAPGTSIGAAHPVSGSGADIEGDMREKATNMTTAMVRSISEERGRNVEWAEKAVKESASITDKQAVEQGVVDFVAEDLNALLKKIAGKKVKIGQEEQVLEDYSLLPRRTLEIDIRDRGLNLMANPNVAAILWLIATTGITVELYNPGLIFPGVVGVIALILALAVTQVIPISQGSLLLLVLGALLIGGELFVPSGILGIGGLIAMAIGAMYLVDGSLAPGLAVDWTVVSPFVIIIGVLWFWTIREVIAAYRNRPATGNEGMIGDLGTVMEPVSHAGKVFVNGEIWNATAKSGIIDRGSSVRVVAVLEGLILEVEPVERAERV